MTGKVDKENGPDLEAMVQRIVREEIDARQANQLRQELEKLVVADIQQHGAISQALRQAFQSSPLGTCR